MCVLQEFSKANVYSSIDVADMMCLQEFFDALSNGIQTSFAAVAKVLITIDHVL